MPARDAGHADQGLVVVVGPTAAGKSSLAVRVARALDGEVVSADSQQVYRGFDVGTGKLTMEERQGVAHHLIDVVDPGAHFSAARFVELAGEAISSIRARGRAVVVAGGTGLYVKALLYGLFEAPPPDGAIRAAHRRSWQRDPEELRRRLQEIDPEAAARIMPRDFVRISRALEVYEQTGLPITVMQQRHGFAQRRYRALLVGLRPGRDELRRRIDARVDWMMAHGWREEVERLIAAGHGETRPMGALGYRQLRAHLRGGLPLEEAVRQTKRDTWRFARRQLNWFATERSEVEWHDDGAEVDVEGVRAALEALQD
jgi:tRNA dimethylallyltransferase